MTEFKNIRQELGVSQKDMAGIMGVTVSCIQNLERTTPRFNQSQVFIKFARALLYLHKEGMLMPVNPLRFYVKMLDTNKFAVYDSVRQYNVGVFVELDDANAFRDVLIAREEKRLSVLTNDMP